MNGKWKQMTMAVLVGSTAALACGSTQAMSFGSPSSRTILGAPLRVSMPLVLSNADEVGDECLMAEVYFGEVKVSQEQVSALVKRVSDSEYLLLVGTSAAVNEPVVTVNLSYGCQSKYSRQFIVFADPQIDAPSVPVVSDAASPLPQTGTLAAEPKPSVPVVAGGTVTVPPATISAPAKPRRARGADTARAVEGLAVPQARKVSPEQATGAASKPAARKDRVTTPPAKGKAAGPRLQLDPVDMAPVDPLSLGRSLPAASAASAVSPSASVAASVTAAASQPPLSVQARLDQDKQRMDEMEKRIAQLHAEVGSLRSKQSSSSPVTGLVATLAAVTSVLSAYLFVQWRREKKARAWLQSELT